ncbi:sulfite exporter TauE/SafE family protein [Runella slithyformis]|uniref:sulfite exporter TauE/SafE family protein n=1 Tax=Runella slithyformis TaxID=106 RepID=UPI0002D3BEC4|nr:TSUP family transporter [Runella slithyformis]
MDILIASFAALLAGFVDSIVGGGGLVQVPALFILFPHFSVSQVIGTNRFASFVGTSVAGYQYARKVEVPWRVVCITASGTAVMSFLGATIASHLKAEVLKPLILFLMTAIAVYSFSNKTLGQYERVSVSVVRLQWYALLIGMAMGFYNGFVGPGTGSLLVFGFVSIMGYQFLRASAVAKVINVVADVASLAFFIWKGYVEFDIAFPMMACNVLGAYLGSRLAILRGNTFIRKVFLIVIFGLILRFGYDVWRLLS